MSGRGFGTSRNEYPSGGSVSDAARASWAGGSAVATWGCKCGVSPKKGCKARTRLSICPLRTRSFSNSVGCLLVQRWPYHMHSDRVGDSSVLFLHGRSVALGILIYTKVQCLDPPKGNRRYSLWGQSRLNREVRGSWLRARWDEPWPSNQVRESLPHR